MTIRTVAGMDIDIVRKNIKNINLRVTADGRVSLSAPKKTADKTIDSYIISKKEWIERALLRFRNSQNSVLTFSEGDIIYILGHRFTVHLMQGAGYSCMVKDSSATITVPNESDNKNTEAYMREWYRSLLKSIIPEHLSKWEGITGLSCSGWTTRYMRTKWGVCNCNTNKICFNVRLAEKPIECIEYVVLHELAHTAVHDHSPAFKAILNRYMPDWKERKNILNYGTGSR